MGKVVKGIVDVTVGIVSGEYLTKAFGKVIDVLGNDILDDALGLDKIGNEIGDIGKDIYQVGKVLGGEYHDDLKKIQNQQEQVQKRINNYNSEIDKLVEKSESLFMLPEIFQLASANRVDAYADKYGPEIAKAIKELESAINRLKSEYDFVLGLTQGPFIQKFIGSIIMIVGGLSSDLKDIGSGMANGDTYSRILTVTLTIVAIILLMLTPGLQGVALAVAITLASIAAFMTLDGMYANGAATGAIMSSLDFLFNDLLNLDDFIGKDFNKFDKDHEDYAEMVMFVKIGLTLASIYTAWTNAGTTAITASSSSLLTPNAGTAGTYGTNLGSQQTAMLAQQDLGLVNNATSYLNGSLVIGDSMATSSFLGVTFSTYKDIYSAYNAASKVGDVVEANKQYEDLKTKLENDRIKVEEVIISKYRKNFMKHYKDTAYFLQDQQEFIDRYVWSMTSQNMYVDPYGTTPVANIRFTPDKDTRVMQFGFEDVFNENNLAGSAGYFKSIIYGN